MHVSEPGMFYNSLLTAVEVVQCSWTLASVLGRSQSRFHFHGCPVEVVQACVLTMNVTKFSFDNIRGCAMLVDSCFSAGKSR